MEQIARGIVSNSQLFSYNALFIICMLILVWRNRGAIIPILTIFLFFSGIFPDIFGNIGRNVFRISILCVSLWFAIKSESIINLQLNYPKVFWSIVAWCGYFIVDSVFINHDSILLTFSLLSKFLIPILILSLIITESEEDDELIYDLYWLFGTLIVVQIFLSIAKMIILGGFLEGWVGSMTGLTGGGAGTSLPLLGLMWLALKNDMNFSRKDICFAVGLLIIGFAAGKRAVWILFPIVFLFLYMWVYRKNLGRQIIIILGLAPLLIYLAVRISPTFNPENKVWGSFDLEYATNYIIKYSSGIDENQQEVQSGEGRLGALAWLIEKSSVTNKKVLFGRGNEFITYAGGVNYYNEDYFEGISSKGSITGIVNTFFVFGIIGIVLYLYCVLMLFTTNISRYNILLLGIVMEDYIFYNAQILNLMPLLLLVLFLSFFSNQLIENYGSINEQLTL